MTPETNPDLPLLRDVAGEIASLAGETILRLALEKREVAYKGHRDMVTQVDKAAETLIVNEILKRFPKHNILAEEGGDSNQSNSPYRWIIDPLDGTTNFVHGFPIFCVSIGVEFEGAIVAAAVYDPSRAELFQAAKGEGATLNLKPIHVSQTEQLDRSLLGTGFPYTNNAQFDLNMDLWRQIYGKTQGLRRAGAAALDLAWVACGRLDGYWEFCIKPWDMAAGALLVQEAGGVVSDPHGATLNIYAGDIVAGNQHIQAHLLNEISPFRDQLPAT